jgi:flagellar biosynthetic protein FliR
MLERLALTYAATFALVLSRIAGFVVVSPFPGANVGRTQRVGLVFGLAWVATLYAPAAAAPREIALPLLFAAVQELACGLVIGLAFRFLFMAAEVAGQLLSQAVGLSSATTLNPTLGAQDMILSRVVTLLALLLALGAGIHRVALGYLLASLRALPVGTPMSLSGTSMVFVDLSITSFAVGVQLAMPVIGVMFVVHLGLAMIARAAPALQIFSVGLSVLLATGSLVLLASLHDVGTGFIVHFGALSRWLDMLLVSLSGRAP